MLSKFQVCGKMTNEGMVGRDNHTTRERQCNEWLVPQGNGRYPEGSSTLLFKSDIQPRIPDRQFSWFKIPILAYPPYGLFLIKTRTTGVIIKIYFYSTLSLSQNLTKAVLLSSQKVSLPLYFHELISLFWFS